MTAPKAIEPRDIPALAEFLLRVYKFDPADHHANAKLLEWKYLSPRSGWPRSRSFVFEKNGRIVAHCGVCPVTFQLSAGAAVAGITMMDWAADPSVPGIGIAIFRKLMAMSPASFVIGGSPATRHIIPRIGFQAVGEAQTFSAWLRPWSEFRRRTLTSRSPLRLAHGITHPVRRHGESGKNWEVREVTEFDDSLQPILDGPKRSWTGCKRTLADLNLLLKCPHMKMTGFLLLNRTRIAGYAVVGRFDWEARILVFSIDSVDEGDWRAGIRALTKVIQLDSGACRIRVQSTLPILTQSLAWNGYWHQYSEPIFIHDPSHALDRAFPVAFQLCDGDAGF